MYGKYIANLWIVIYGTVVEWTGMHQIDEFDVDERLFCVNILVFPSMLLS